LILNTLRLFSSNVACALFEKGFGSAVCTTLAREQLNGDHVSFAAVLDGSRKVT
jgi:hypothetical protein